jgi:hypothetical protein
VQAPRGPSGKARTFRRVVGGVQLIVADGDPLAELSGEQRALIDILDMAVASPDPAAPHSPSSPSEPPSCSGTFEPNFR